MTRMVLPRWTQSHKAVVWLAERDLAFRCNVCTAKATNYRRALIRQAEEVYKAKR